MQTGEKRKSGSEEIFVKFEEIFPLNGKNSHNLDAFFVIIIFCIVLYVFFSRK